MSYTFSASEQAQIQSLFLNGPAVGQPGNFSSMYTYIAQVLTTRLSDGSISAGEQLAMTHARNWFDVAKQANGNVGFHSAFIRAYTNRQGELRLNRSFTQSEMQEASNGVARRVFAHIQSSGWQAPTTNLIEEEDATAVGEVLFQPFLPSNDTAVSRNAGWSGCLGFALLGDPAAANRLLSSGASGQAADTLDDFKN